MQKSENILARLWEMKERERLSDVEMALFLPFTPTYISKVRTGNVSASRKFIKAAHDYFEKIAAFEAKKKKMLNNELFELSVTATQKALALVQYYDLADVNALLGKLIWEEFERCQPDISARGIFHPRDDDPSLLPTPPEKSRPSSDSDSESGISRQDRKVSEGAESVVSSLSKSKG